MRLSIVFAALAALLAIGVSAQAQICEVRYTTKNQSRYVTGPVNEECGWPDELHSAPFGNWGVDTEYSGRVDGHQFQGWCRYRRLTDNNGQSDMYCEDSWLQWHSCTSDLARFRAPNTDFFNAANGREQQTIGGTNGHGSGVIGLNVSCPVDTDGDFHPDSGGCLDLLRRDIPVSGHRMKIYELDGWPLLFNDDDWVSTLRFPTLYAPVSGISCDTEWCGGGRTGSFRSSTLGSSRVVSASAAVEITSASFVNNGGCCDPVNDNTCN